VNPDLPDYGLWPLVFIIFAFSFTNPKTARDCAGWLSSRYPGIDRFAHHSGHLFEMVFGWKDSPHFGPFYLLSTVFIFGGFGLLASAWRALYPAQREEREARAEFGGTYLRYVENTRAFLPRFGAAPGRV